MSSIQNYFIQITISKGRILQNEDGSTSKVVDEIPMDSLFCKDADVSITPIIEKVQEDVEQIINN